MTETLARDRIARRGAGAAAAALAGVMTAGLSAAFLAILVSEQGCGGAQSTASEAAIGEIPPTMLAAYQEVGARYGLPWEILAGIGQEECRHGLDRQPSCAVQVGQRGPGIANAAGASGPMQVGVGGAAGPEYQTLRGYLPEGQRDLGPHDPLAATELAALVLTRAKGAAAGRGIDFYWPYVKAYNGSGGAAAAYASRVIADAQRYQEGVVLLSGACPLAAGTYVNPFARASGVVAGRIDMGVDYTGRGPIVALGDARVTYAATHDSGWAYCGAAGAVTLELVDGPEQGRLIYITEGVTPLVGAGQSVVAGQAIATFGGTGCIEIGWSAVAAGASPEAAALGQEAHRPGEDPGQNRTYCGQSMSQFLASLGAAAGLGEVRPVVGDRC